MGEEQRKALENKNKKCWMGADITQKNAGENNTKCWTGAGITQKRVKICLKNRKPIFAIFNRPKT